MSAENTSKGDCQTNVRSDVKIVERKDLLPDTLATFFHEKIREQCARLKIRQCVLSDVKDQLLKLDKGILSRKAILEFEKLMPNRSPGAVFCAFNGKEIIGYAMVVDMSSYVKPKFKVVYELNAIWLAPEYRMHKPTKSEDDDQTSTSGEHGFAHALRESCIAFAREKGASHVVIANAAKEYRKQAAEESWLRRGFKSVALDRPLSWVDLMLDLKSDLIFVHAQLHRHRLAFHLSIADMVEVLDEFADLGADIRNVILDGRLWDALQKGRPLKETWYCFWPVRGLENFSCSELRGVMSRREIQRWMQNRLRAFEPKKYVMGPEQSQFFKTGDILVGVPSMVPIRNLLRCGSIPFCYLENENQDLFKIDDVWKAMNHFRFGRERQNNDKGNSC